MGAEHPTSSPPTLALPHKGRGRDLSAGPSSPMFLFLSLSGVLLALVGYWRPWIPHKAAGLALTAWDLTEWVKFLPAWRAGTLNVQREVFYLPLIASGLALALMAPRLRSRLARWALWALGGILCLLVLPAYELLFTAYRGGEGQSQFFLALAGFALVLLSPLARAWSGQLYGAVLTALGLIGLGLPLWQLALLRPVVAQVYAEPVGWGIGAILNSIGFSLVTVSGLWMAGKG